MVFALTASVRPNGMMLSASIESVTVCSLPLKLVMNTGTSNMSPSVKKRGKVACIVSGSRTNTFSSAEAKRVGDAVQAITRTEPLYCGIEKVVEAFPLEATSTNPRPKSDRFDNLGFATSISTIRAPTSRSRIHRWRRYPPSNSFSRIYIQWHLRKERIGWIWSFELGEREKTFINNSDHCYSIFLYGTTKV